MGFPGDSDFIHKAAFDGTGFNFYCFLILGHVDDEQAVLRLIAVDRGIQHGQVFVLGVVDFFELFVDLFSIEIDGNAAGLQLLEQGGKAFLGNDILRGAQDHLQRFLRGQVDRALRGELGFIEGFLHGFGLTDFCHHVIQKLGRGRHHGVHLLRIYRKLRHADGGGLPVCSLSTHGILINLQDVVREQVAEDKHLICVLEYGHASHGFIFYLDEHFGVHAVAGHGDAHVVQKLNNRGGLSGGFLAGSAEELGNQIPVQVDLKINGAGAGRNGRGHGDGRSTGGILSEGCGHTCQRKHQGKHQGKHFFHSRFLLVHCFNQSLNVLYHAFLSFTMNIIKHSFNLYTLFTLFSDCVACGASLGYDDREIKSSRQEAMRREREKQADGGEYFSLLPPCLQIRDVPCSAGAVYYLQMQ